MKFHQEFFSRAGKRWKYSWPAKIFKKWILRNSYYIATIDAKILKNLHDFIVEIGKAFQFPDYYGENMNAFYECINDLDWIEEKNYRLVLKNSQYFLCDEDAATRKEILDALFEVRSEWASVPNYEGEEIYRSKADFQISLE